MNLTALPCSLYLVLLSQNFFFPISEYIRYCGMSLSISWKGRKQVVYFDQEYQAYKDEWPHHVLLKDLLQRISKASSVPLENIKLLYGGGMY